MSSQIESNKWLSHNIFFNHQFWTRSRFQQSFCFVGKIKMVGLNHGMKMNFYKFVTVSMFSVQIVKIISLFKKCLKINKNVMISIQIFKNIALFKQCLKINKKMLWCRSKFSKSMHFFSSVWRSVRKCYNFDPNFQNHCTF